MPETYNVLGMMSGTSLDGLDLCLATFTFDGSWKYKILAAETIPYDARTVEHLSELLYAGPTALEEAHHDFGRYLGEAAGRFIRNSGADVLVVASHGHTIHHKPEKGITFQLGDGQEIADSCGLKVVSDFRSRDVKLGGQGAPLVPAGDHHLFQDYDACLNLGGFSNISLVHAGRRIAFDICPVNMLLNEIAQKVGLQYDEGGRLASAGEVDEDILAGFEGLDYYRKKGPRSLGREWYEKEVSPILSQSKASVPDLMRTSVEHITRRLAASVSDYRINSMLITGGGAFNSFLIRKLEGKVRSRLVVPEPELVQYKEALVFAFLGLLRMKNEVNVFSSATGASSDHSAGRISQPGKKKKGPI